MQYESKIKALRRKQRERVTLMLFVIQYLQLTVLCKVQNKLFRLPMTKPILFIFKH